MTKQDAINQIRKLITGLRNETISRKAGVQQINVIKRDYLHPLIEHKRAMEIQHGDTLNTPEWWAFSILSDVQEMLDWADTTPNACKKLEQVINVLQGKFKSEGIGRGIEVSGKFPMDIAKETGVWV